MAEPSADLGPALTQLPPAEVQPRRALCLNVEAYLERLRDEDWALNEEQRTDVIKALWQMLVPFAEMGFAIHPVQQICGQSDDEREPIDVDAAEVVDSNDGDMRSAFVAASRKGEA
ncbi:MAG: hypothetical protein AAF830_07180 [Pseudomonadota bacterium]